MIVPLGFIYCLKHPDTGEIFYVGATQISLKNRIRTHYQHLREYQRGLRTGNKRYRYLESLLPKKAEISLLKLVQNEDIDEQEIFFIKSMRKIYPNLTNMTDGGRGKCTSKYYTEAEMEKYSAKISRSNKGRKKPEGFATKLSENRKGKNNPMCGHIINGGLVCFTDCGPKLFRHNFEINLFCNSKHAGSNVRKYFRTGLPYGFSWKYYNDCDTETQDIVQSAYERSSK